MSQKITVYQPTQNTDYDAHYMHRGTSTHRSSQTLDPSYTQNKFTHTHFNHAVSLHSYGLTDPWTLAHVPSCTDPCAPSPIFLPSFTSSLAMRLAVWWVPGSPFCLWATSGAGPSNLCRLPVTDFWERGKEPRQVFHKLLTMYVTSTKKELICPFV